MIPDDAVPVPARITMALDSRKLYGPEVDLACGTWEGNPDGDVDAWEVALAVPTRGQVEKLAELTHYPLEWFYKPIAPGPLTGVVFVCTRPRSKSKVLQPNFVDDRGVLHYEGKRRELPNPQGALF